MLENKTNIDGSIDFPEKEIEIKLDKLFGSIPAEGRTPAELLNTIMDSKDDDLIGALILMGVNAWLHDNYEVVPDAEKIQ